MSNPDEAPPVLLQIDGGVARLTLNRPRRANAIDIGLADGLTTALECVATDERARVVLLRAEGKQFCAGGDLVAMAAAADRESFVASLVTAAHRAVRRLAALDKPVIAAVHGPAAGAGLSLVLLSDIVLTAPAATFTTAYTTVGLSPDCGQSYLLPRAIGATAALDLLLQPRRMTAAEAELIGLVTRVVGGDLNAEADSLARAMAAGPARAFGATRKLVRDGLSAGLDAQLDREAMSIARLAGTFEADALIRAAATPR